MELQDYKSKCLDLLATTAPDLKAALARIEASDLYPPFLLSVLQALDKAKAQGYSFWVTQGERTWDEQHKLYCYGRTDMSRGIVTKVDAGDSAHNYAVAADAAYDLDPDKAGLQPSWDKGFLQHWADAGVASGLDAGFYWQSFFDGPHVQLNIRKYGLGVKHLKAKYAQGGKLAVFKFLDTFNWSQS